MRSISFVLMPRGAFTGISVCFLFSRSIFLKMGTVYDCPSQGWAKPSPTEGKPGRMPVPSRLKVFSRSGTYIHPLYGLPFHVFRQVPFSSHADFRSFFSNLPPPLCTSIFTSSGEPHQPVIFVLATKVIPGLDGNVRSSLLFFPKIAFFPMSRARQKAPPFIFPLSLP